jgi:4-amino-4-deoxy-L-arabinose transferase-like glycosyltransferase
VDTQLVVEPVTRRALARAPWLPPVGAVTIAATLTLHELDQNGWANPYYAATVRSMLASWHNFVYASFDPAGLVAVDKPPLALWLQAASAELFGFTPLSLLAPQAIAGVLCVWLMYLIVARRFGRAAGTITAVALAVWPAAVAVDRHNNPDALLVLCLVAAAGAGMHAVETGRLRWLLASAAFVGLGFNVKMLAAYVVVPAIVGVHLARAPGSLRRRASQLLLFGAVVVAVSAPWVALVDLTPPAQRPYVGDTTDNRELSLVVGANGLARIDGPSSGRPRANGAAPDPALAASRSHVGGLPGPLRLLESGLGRQGGWLIPFSIVGGLLVALTPALWRGRRRSSALAILGGWFVVEAVALSAADGIVHPYYLSALAPPVAGLVGIGAVAMRDALRRGERRGSLAALAIGVTCAVELVLLRRDAGSLGWLELPLAAAIALLAPLLAIGLVPRLRGRAAPRRASVAALAVGLCVMLAVPAAWSQTLWDRPTSATDPAAGPAASGSPSHHAPDRSTQGDGSPGLDTARLLQFLSAHARGARYLLATQDSLTAAPLILASGLPIVALGGFGGRDPVLTVGRLRRLVAAGALRYLLLPLRSPAAWSAEPGTALEAAVARACPTVPAARWDAHGGTGDALYDCAGRAAELTPW